MNEIPVLPETTVASVIAGVLPELVTIRRDIHAHPELSREETRTTALLRGRLDRAGTRVTPMPRTGLVADIGAREPRLRIGLRADIDALPVQERTGLDWASTVDGVISARGAGAAVTETAPTVGTRARARAIGTRGMPPSQRSQRAVGSRQRAAVDEPESDAGAVDCADPIRREPPSSVDWGHARFAGRIRAPSHR